jgi:hypothetical protein
MEIPDFRFGSPVLCIMIEECTDEVADAFRRIEGLIGAREARAVMEDARNDLSAGIDALERSVRLPDEKMFRLSGHALIGVLSTFGFKKAERLCHDFIDAGPAQVTDLGALRSEISSIMAKLQVILRSDPGFVGS